MIHLMWKSGAVAQAYLEKLIDIKAHIKVRKLGIETSEVGIVDIFEYQ